MDAKCIRMALLAEKTGQNAKKMKVVRLIFLQVIRLSIKTVSKPPTSLFSWWKMCPVMLTMNDMLFFLMHQLDSSNNSRQCIVVGLAPPDAW